jgi:sucrose-6-phosphate hydrolase SacC (GH32 family)
VGRAAAGRLRAIGIVDERRTPPSQERAGWANVFGLPRVWSLRPDGQSLGQAPAPELAALRGASLVDRRDMVFGKDASSLASGLGAYELLLELDARQTPSGPIEIEVLASPDGRETTRLSFDPALGRVGVDKRQSSLSGEDEGPQLLLGEYDARAFGPMRTLRVFVDGSTIEVFINDAAAYAVRSYPLLSASTGLRVAAPGQPPFSASVQLWPLRRPPGNMRQLPSLSAAQ